MSKTIFSEKIRQLRKEKRLTQQEVAEKLGLTKRQYGYLEYGNFTCDYCHIIKICELYKVSANELFGIKETYSYPQLEINEEV